MQVNTQNSANANQAQSPYPLALNNTSQYKQTYYFIWNASLENWEIMGNCLIPFVLKQQIHGFFCKSDTYIYIFLALSHGFWDLSSQIRERTQALGNEITES